MKKILLFTALFISFTGESIANDWQYTESKDEMRDKVRYAATLMSENESPSSPDSAMSLDIILLSDDADISDKAGLNLSKAHYSCKRDEQCDVKIRFDNGRVENLYTSATDPNKEVLLIDDSAGFVEKLRLSKRVIIEIPVHGNGRSQFKFFPDGLKWQGIEPGRRYLSEFAGINLKEKINLNGKKIFNKDNGSVCFDETIELIKGVNLPSNICTYDGMVSLITVETKNDKKLFNKLVRDINKSLNVNETFTGDVAYWMGGETLGVSSIFIGTNSKDGLRLSFLYQPTLSRIPPKE